jgi:dTDP-4-dehydrorhamnose 3,5-epimerase
MAESPNVESLPLAGALLLSAVVHRDERGFLLESYNRAAWQAAGVECDFVQDNHSRSQRGTLRGMHYQSGPGQAKLVRVLAGCIFDAIVDIRPDSPTLGRWTSVELDDAGARQLFVPAGFAHGFCVLSDFAEVAYKLSTYYDPSIERGFQWNDPDVGIEWPVNEPLLSARDRSAEPFAALRARLVGSP